MISAARKLGIDVLGAVPWGTHICQFYNTKRDLVNILVPYFQAGLENNEFCLWITSFPLNAKEAEAAMRKAVPDLSQYLANQQMEFIPHTEWYLKGGTFHQKRALDASIDKLEQALTSGYDGMRATGDTAWVEREHWNKLISYEEEVHNIISNYSILAICTYPLRKCRASQVVDVLNIHHYNIINQRGKLALFGSSEYQQVEKELREIEEFSSNLLTYFPNPILIVNPDTSIRYANPALEKLTGFSAEEIVGRKAPYPWWTPETLQNTHKDLKKAMRQEAVKVEELFQKKNGERFWVAISTMPVKHEGRINYYWSSWMDITEQKLAKEKKNTVAKTAIDGFWVINLEGKFLEVNDSYCQIIGYTREELLKISISDIETVENSQDIARHIEKVIEQGSGHFETRHKRKDGRIIDVEVNINYLDVDEGQLFGSLRDITDLKQAEAALRESEEFSSNLLTYSPHPILVINPDTSVRYVNPALEKLTGFSAEEIVGRKAPYPWWTPETLQGTNRDLRKAMREGAVRLEELFQKENGERFWVEISSTAVKHKGKLKYYRASWMDITERKQAEIVRLMPLRPTSGRRMLELQKRFIREGFEGLEDQEIIELLLSLVLPARKAKQLAIACLEKFKNLSNFLTASPKELQQISITPASMFCIKLLHELPIKLLKQKIVARSIYKSSSDVFNYLYYSMRDLKNEVFKVIYLDNRSQIIDTVDLFEGTQDIIHIRSREIIENAIEHNATGLIFVHNHPNGDPTPSTPDKQLTKDLVFVGNILQINVIDHIIIGADSYFSFADDGLIHKYQDNFFNLKMRGLLASASIYR